MRVLHVLNNLLNGGTEQKVYDLLRGASPDVISTVICAVSERNVKAEFEALPRVKVVDLGLPSGAIRPKGIPYIALRMGIASLKTGPADIIHTWNEGTLPFLPVFAMTKPGAGGYVLSFDNHGILAEKPAAGLAYKAAMAMASRFSRFKNAPAVTLSDDMRKGLLSYNYSASLIHVITNGVDVDKFIPQKDAAKDLCRELGIPEGSHLIGIASRHGSADNSNLKDVAGFVDAAAALKKAVPALFARTHFVICGQGTDDGDLMQRARDLGLADKMHVLGPRRDMPRLYAAWDVANMTSLREPFGLVAAESMAAGTPCVVTDVDLLPTIVGDPRLVVPVKDADARAKAWSGLLSMTEGEREELGARLRFRAVKEFSAATMGRAFDAIYRAVLNEPPRGRKEVVAGQPDISI